MTIYLPNNDVQPVGWEPLEFLDLPPMAEVERSRSEINSADESNGRLSDEIRFEIAQRVYERLSGLVDSHDGDVEDVYLIARTLGDRSVFGDHGDRRGGSSAARPPT
jgi:hypothetical protein